MYSTMKIFVLFIVDPELYVAIARNSINFICKFFGLEILVQQYCNNNTIFIHINVCHSYCITIVQKNCIKILSFCVRQYFFNNKTFVNYGNTFVVICSFDELLVSAPLFRVNSIEPETGRVYLYKNTGVSKE